MRERPQTRRRTMDRPRFGSRLPSYAVALVLATASLLVGAGPAAADQTLATCGGIADNDTWIETQGSYSGHCYSNFTVSGTPLATLRTMPGPDFTGSLRASLSDFEYPPHQVWAQGKFVDGILVDGEMTASLTLSPGYWVLNVWAGGRDPATGSYAASVTTPSPTAPGAPQGLTASTAKPKGVALAWSSPASTGGSPITGYRIYRGTTSRAETFLKTVNDVSSYTDTATKKGVTYYYLVQAVNAIGGGPQSNEASAQSG
jgi:hypothetical protein